MTYNEWFESFAKKHKKIVKKLLEKKFTQEQIIEYFDFENMRQNEPDFCPLYAENKKCHDLKSLNCYFCACPNFRFDDKGIKELDTNTQYSFCSIDSKDGKQGLYGKAIHQDCSGCSVPHHRAYIEKHFDLNWRKVMQECKIEKKNYNFSSNVNFYNKDITLDVNADLLTQEKKGSYKLLENAVAHNYDLKTNQVALYDSVSTAIKELFSSLKRKEIFFYTPLGGKYEKIALATKKNIYHINRINELHEEPLEETIVVFANPSMPEGAYHEDEIDKLFEKWMELECTIIIDESFLEFENLKSLRVKIDEYKRLYIIQSLTHFYACDGIKAGAIFSNKKNIEKLNPDKESISILDALFLEQRLQDESFKSESRRLLTQQKKQLHVTLQESTLFDEIVPSATNYILAYSARGEEIYKHLKKQNILVRKCGSFDYLTDNWLRFSVQNDEAQTALKEALSALT